MSQSVKKMWLDGIFEEDVQKPSIILCNNYLYCANPKCLNKHFDDFTMRKCIYNNYKHFRDNKIMMEEEKKALEKEIIEITFKRFTNEGLKVIIK